MNLSADSKLAKWAYMFRSKRTVWDPNDPWTAIAVTRVPRQTTLCAFFWRAFVFMPLAWLAILCWASLVSYHVSRLIWLNWSVVWHYAALIATAAALTVSTFVLLRRYDNTLTQTVHKTKRTVDTAVQTIKTSVFWQGAKSLKSRFCPIITFEGGK